jgi:microcompartment protein CcmK/EutM
MRVCKVLGPVVATAKHPSFHGKTTLTVVPVDSAGKALGEAFIAVDSVQAGEGDLVLVMNEGSGIRQILGEAQSPIRALIVGIVDEVAEAKQPTPIRVVA